MNVNKFHIVNLYLKKIWQIYSERGVSITLRHISFKLKKRLFPFNDHRALKLSKKIKKKIATTSQEDINLLLNEGFIKNKKYIKQTIFNLSPSSKNELIQEARKLLNNKFIIYGALEVEYTEKFSWHTDPLTGFTWPQNCSSHSNVLKKPNGTDIKTIWEIARFQFLCPLAYAFLLTGDINFAIYGIEKLLSWRKENPPFSGPHWTRAMEAAIRLINCATYLPLLFTNELRAKYPELPTVLTLFFIEHLIFICTHFETSPAHSNNHYLANLVGMLAGKILFPSSDFFRKKALQAKQKFFTEILRQFRTDGINYEGSIAYHKLSTEILTAGIILLKKSGSTIPDEITDLLSRIANFTQIYTNASDEIPLIGDNDNGIFWKYFSKQEIESHQYLNILLDIAQENISTIPKKKYHLILSHFAIKTTNKFKKHKLKYKKDKNPNIHYFDGLIIAKHLNNVIFFNTLNNGMWGSGGHTHNDKLAIYPVINNQLLFVDRGSFSYTGYPILRNEDRSALNHNGPVINKWEQNLFNKTDLFHIWGKAKCGRKISIKKSYIELIGWHDAYIHKKPPIRVYRHIVWIFTENIIQFTDWFESYDDTNNIMLMSWKYIINPLWNIYLKNNTIYLTQNNYSIIFNSHPKLKLNIHNDIYYRTYQTKTKSLAIDTSIHVHPSEKTTFTIQY